MKNEVSVNEMQGPLKDFFEQLSGRNGRARFEEFKLWLKKVEKKLLTHICTLHIPAQPASTTSKEYFEEAGVRYFWSNFESQFFGLEVEATGPIELAISKLNKDSFDGPVLTELGDMAEISVSQFREFLATNRKSPEWFIFYLRGRDGNLWAVIADWYSDNDGWDVRAGSVEDPSRWRAGDHVVSRN